MSDFKSEWFVAFQRLVPQHGLSRLGSSLAEAKTPWLKNALIKRFIRTYNVNLDEAVSSNLDDYLHFNDFFTRALKDGVRPIDQGEHTIVCPADGAISQLGSIEEGNIFQAKGKSFSTATLLGANDADSQRFLNGNFITIYLSPRDYHRVHMPINGELLYSRYIPGKLFSVNDTTTQYVDGLFAKNERLVCMFDTPVGRCAVILVGAMMVAGIESVWHGHYQPNTVMVNQFGTGEVALKKGQEVGRFKFGSTAILMFEPGKIEWSEQYSPGTTTRLGQLLATKILTKTG
ncbi:MAG: phosphatidylserine decarboxylase [Porticoccaceae bacterium]|nr:MAG: phosphatidylserine decarboxylase [Porticoccaceae bacterium]